MVNINIFFPLVILFVILIMILLIYFILRITGGKKSTLNLSDYRFMGSTVFLVGVSGIYKDAVIPIPIEGIIIGSDAAEANIILSDAGISPQQVRVVFHERKYDSIIVENLGEPGSIHYSVGSEWQPLWGGQSFSSSQPAKIRIGANQEIFEIIFRL